MRAKLPRQVMGLACALCGIASAADAQESGIRGIVVEVRLSDAFQSKALDPVAHCAAWTSALSPGRGPWGFGISSEVICPGATPTRPEAWTLKLEGSNSRGSASLCRPRTGSCEARVEFPMGEGDFSPLQEPRFVNLLAAALLDNLPFVSLLHEGVVDPSGNPGPKVEDTKAYAIPPWTAPLEPILLREENGIFSVVLLKDKPVKELLMRKDVWLVSKGSGRHQATLSAAIEAAYQDLLKKRAEEPDWSLRVGVEGGGLWGLGTSDLKTGWTVAASADMKHRSFLGMGIRGESTVMKREISHNFLSDVMPDTIERKNIEVEGVVRALQAHVRGEFALGSLSHFGGLSFLLVQETLTRKIDPLSLERNQRQEQSYPATLGLLGGVAFRPTPSLEGRIRLGANFGAYPGWESEAKILYGMEGLRIFGSRGSFVNVFFRASRHAHLYRYHTVGANVETTLSLMTTVLGMGIETKW